MNKKMILLLVTELLLNSYSISATSAESAPAVTSAESNLLLPERGASEPHINNAPAEPTTADDGIISTTEKPPEGGAANKRLNSAHQPEANKNRADNETLNSDNKQMVDFSARLDSMQAALRQRPCDEANILSQANAPALLLKRFDCIEENLLKLRTEMALLSPVATAPVALNTALQQQAYASGVALAYTIKNAMHTQAAYHIVLDPKLILTGIDDVFTQRPLRMDEKSIRLAMEQLNQLIQQKMKQDDESQQQHDEPAAVKESVTTPEKGKVKQD